MPSIRGLQHSSPPYDLPLLSTTNSSQTSTNHHLPRLLCLHGGGVNARIFRKQCRVLIRQFAPYYRLVFADGPYVCQGHHDMFPVYQDYGPFRRWLRWLPEHGPVDDDDAVEAIESSMRQAMEADDAEGGTGEWVGLLGFSQGAKVAASVLFETQMRRKMSILHLRRDSGYGEEREVEFKMSEKSQRGFAGADRRFAVLLAGRAPLVSLSDLTYDMVTFDLPGALVPPPIAGELSENQFRLELPTVHMHGLKDVGLELHRMLRNEYTTSGSADVLEWDGNHRVPIKSQDVSRLVQATLKASKVSVLVAVSYLNYHADRVPESRVHLFQLKLHRS